LTVVAATVIGVFVGIGIAFGLLITNDNRPKSTVVAAPTVSHSAEKTPVETKVGSPATPKREAPTMPAQAAPSIRAPTMRPPLFPLCIRDQRLIDFHYSLLSPTEKIMVDECRRRILNQGDQLDDYDIPNPEGAKLPLVIVLRRYWDILDTTSTRNRIIEEIKKKQIPVGSLLENLGIRGNFMNATGKLTDEAIENVEVMYEFFFLLRQDKELAVRVAKKIGSSGLADLDQAEKEFVKNNPALFDAGIKHSRK
jgi:hypothetical protein